MRRWSADAGEFGVIVFAALNPGEAENIARAQFICADEIVVTELPPSEVTVTELP